MNDSLSSEPERGGCLTIFLVLMIVFNLLAALYYIFAGTSLSQTLPSFPEWAIPVLTLGAAANVIFAIGVWKWKRWGVYGFAVTSAVAFVVNFIGAGLLTALFGLIGFGLLVFLVRDAWPQME